MYKTKAGFIEMLDRELPYIQLPGQFFTKDRLSNNQIFGALTTYARGVNPNSIIGIADPTDDISGKEGVLFSTSAVYFSDAELSNGKHGYTMIMYRDITGAQADGILLNACVEISVKNLPFSSVIIKDMTLNMKPLAAVIEKIVEFKENGFEFESDRKASIDVVKYYLKKQESIMNNIFSRIINNEDIPKEYCGCKDGLGLTPLHYCLLLNNERLAVSIAKETAKYYLDIYIDGNPTGLYNYCFLAAYKDLRDAFCTIYEQSTDMKPIMEQRKKQNIKNGIIKAVDFGLDFIPGSNILKGAKKGGKIIKKGAELANNNYVRAGVDIARNKIENNNVNSLYEDDLTHDMWFTCKEAIMELKNGEPDFEDPRYYILYQLYCNREALCRRVESDSKSIVCWNKRYLYLTDYEISSDSVWSDLIVDEE